MYYLAYDRAKDMLQKNRPVLEKIVDELLEFEILTGKVSTMYPSVAKWNSFYLENVQFVSFLAACN